MSDDDEGQAAGFFLFPSPTEVKRAQEQYQMGHQAFYHDMLDFLQKQTDEDMVTLSSLVRLSATNSDQLAGIIEGIMVSRGFCPACGKRHDESIDQILEEAEPKVTSEVQYLPPDRQALLEEYNVTDNDDDPKVDPKVVCLGCGMEYQSLEDRMLRKPNACHGCQHKAKWG